MKLKEYLKQNKIKQKDLREFVGCSKSNISLIVNGKSNPSLTTYIKILKFCKNKVDIIPFIGGDK
jgi:transcriptional regulator with XRE-family HTH domain